MIFVKYALLLSFLLNLFLAPVSVYASKPRDNKGGVTAYDLIAAMNSLRVSNGLPELVEDPIVDAVAQATAQTMADNQMSWHIGDVAGRMAAAGYGGGGKVWATENFAVGINQSLDDIMSIWSDDAHMLPAVTAAYCNIGAATATASNGMTYYILQAAYPAGKSCGDYTSGGSNGPAAPPASGATVVAFRGSQLIMPVKIATPEADGKVVHTVQAGQSFWSIAIAYKITIDNLKKWNNLSDESTLKTGQKLIIPDKNTAGYATPTKAGAIQRSKPAIDGKIVHIVQPYQTLSTIAEAYDVKVQTLLTLNGIQADWPLRINQELIVHASDFTPTPTLKPIEMLTPDSDGNYYHVVMNGETLFGIAQYYGISVNQLMVWNGLSDTSIIQPGQKLLLQIAPPPTATETSPPPTATLPATSTPDPRMTATPTATIPPATAVPPPENAPLLGLGMVCLAVIVLLLGASLYFILRYKFK